MYFILLVMKYEILLREYNVGIVWSFFVVIFLLIVWSVDILCYINMFKYYMYENYVSI